MAVGAALCLLSGSACGNGDGTPGDGQDAGGDVVQGDVASDVDMSSEVCDDGIDNDRNNDVDCRDEGCDGASVCSFAQLEAGRSHACGVLESGNVVCWGFNGEGQVGNGESASESVGPTVVEGLEDMVDVTVGLRHSCALSAGGSIYCWGDNNEGQLGDDSFVSSPFPVQVARMTEATAVSAGGFHNCAIGDGETGNGIYCWGLNDRIQVGATVGEETRVPARVASIGLPLLGQLDIDTGLRHSCALGTKSDRSGQVVYCWGDNRSGQLGINESRVDRSAPRRGVRQKSDLSEITDFVEGSLAAGQNSTCAIRQGGSVYCWGDGTQGHFGSEELAEIQYAAVEFPGLRDAQRVWHTLFHVCAERASGRIACWGENGQFAFDDESTVHFNPVLLHDVVDPNDVAPGERFTCWADSDGRAFCQGASESGQLGDPSITESTAEPQRVFPNWK
jgi:alpha-tubulin suppressor-like RCC1 family protein